jgi:hypothetical protein
MAQYPAIIELLDLDGDNGFIIIGETPTDYCGFSVASAGDVNGDGFDDLIVGAPFHPSGSGAGAAYVVFGAAGGFGSSIALGTIDGNNGFQLDGKTVDDEFGRAVSSAGDVNGDGFDDVIVGARYADPNGDKSGAAYVVFGKAGGFDPSLQVNDLDGDDGFLIKGEEAMGYAGISVSSAGDINADGIDDLIVGGHGTDANGINAGASYVVFGKNTGFAKTLLVADLDGNNGFKIAGAAGYDLSGHSVSAAGDVNGDGIDDIIIGADLADFDDPSSGTSYVVFGSESGFGASLILTALDGTNGFRIDGENVLDGSGISVSDAGDVNADGFADIIIGAPGADPHGESSGAAYVLFGSGAGFAASINLLDLDGNDGFQLSGVALGDRAGISVAAAGDVNGDGFDDVIVGADRATTNGTKAGAAYVVFGAADGFPATIEISDLNGLDGFRIDGASAYDYAGISVSSAGDVNGDGLADLIVGSFDDTGNSGGYVVFGRLPDQAVDRTGTAIGQNLVGSNFDDTLSGLGGSDRLFGYDGDDEIRGGDGGDTADAGDGDDFVKGGSGGDTLSGGDDVDDLRGGSNGDTLFGGAGSDGLDGGSGNDELNGDDGNDVLSGSDGTDTLNGGNGDDRLIGGDGKDTLTGGAGVDRFVFGTSADSTSVNFDIVKNADFAADRWDVDGNITAIDATVASGNLSTNGFDTKLANAVGAGQLDANNVVLFTPTAGNLAGKTFLIVDQNGLAGYQANIDLVIELRTPANLGNIDAGDFI